MNPDIGEAQIAKEPYKKYQKTGVSLQGLKVLARRGLARGYPKNLVVHGLDTVIKKNYDRTQYHGNDVQDEKRYISDAEFRAIMRYGSADDILWC